MDRDLELTAFSDAVEAVAAQLDARAVVASGPSRRLIEVAAQIARDPELERETASASRPAPRGAGGLRRREQFAQQFAAAGGTTAARGADVTDVARRIIAELRGVHLPLVPFSRDPVRAGRPRPRADRHGRARSRRSVGLVLRESGRTSHTAIIARARALPAVVGVGFEPECRTARRCCSTRSAAR